MADEKVDLIAGHVDLSIRVGWLNDSIHQAKRTGSFPQYLVAASGYDAALGLKQPQGVADLPFIANLALRDPEGGVSMLPDFLAHDHIKAGRLMRLLPQWSLPSGGIVYPAARYRPPKVTSFVAVLIGMR